jgi:hypothetical protein
VLPGHVNQLLLAFKYYTTGQVVHVGSLTKNHSYPVVGTHRVTGRNGCPAIVFTLQSDYAVTLQIYQPRLYIKCIDDPDIDDINLARKQYKLKYLGLVGLTHAISLNL